VEIAKRLLEQTADRVEQIAYKSGHSSYESMRKAFAKRLGVSPAAYRARFARTHPSVDEASALPAFYESYARTPAAASVQ
jgi:AraC-like DNA-binding protein